MARLFNEILSKREIYERVGSLSQICGSKSYIIAAGKAKGMSAVEIRTGGGLNYTVLPDRGMDISFAEFKGIPLSFISKSGITSPEYFCTDKKIWGESFYGGLLTTCGLIQAGKGCIHHERKFNAHGRISNIPSEDFGLINEWEKDDFIIGVKGCLNEALIYRENLWMTRTISSRLGENKIIIHDVIENNGFENEPLMLIYHMNFGYPIIGEDTVLQLVSEETETKNGFSDYDVFANPSTESTSIMYNHNLKPDENGFVSCKLINNSLKTGVCIKFNKSELWNFMEWKHLKAGDYVVGLEPCNNFGLGVEEEKKNGTLEYIEPGGIREFTLEISFLED